MVQELYDNDPPEEFIPIKKKFLVDFDNHLSNEEELHELNYQRANSIQNFAD